MKFALLPLILCVLLAGCQAGDGSGLDENGQPQVTTPDTGTPTDSPDDSGDSPTPPEETPDSGDTDNGIQATLESIQDNVLSPICAQCHFGSNAPVGLRMDSLDVSQANLINVDATLNPTFKRILPGDAENSFLYLKILGDPVAGNRMPLGLPALTESTIDTIRRWIEAGAPINAREPVVASSRIESTKKEHTLTFTFNQSMNTATLTAEQISVFGTLKEGGTLALNNVQANWLSDNTLSLKVQANTQDITQLHVTFNQASMATLMGRNGHPLDGNKNGFPGGEVSYEFSL